MKPEVQVGREHQGPYLAGVFSVKVSQRGHPRRIRARLVVLLLSQGGVNGGKLALQPLHLQCTYAGSPAARNGTWAGSKLALCSIRSHKLHFACKGSHDWCHIPLVCNLQLQQLLTTEGEERGRGEGVRGRGARAGSTAAAWRHPDIAA